MKKLLAILMSVMMVMSLVACGGSDEAETEVAETTTTESASDEVLAGMEEAATMLFEVLVSTIWLDEEYTAYGFYEDGSMEMQSTAGDVYYATFAVGYDESSLSMIIEGDDFGTLEYAIDIDSMTEGYIAMYDADGNGTVWVPLEADEIAALEELADEEAAATDEDAAYAAAAEEVYTLLTSYYWTDEDGAAYAFETDGSMALAGPDGSEYAGYFEMARDGSVLYLVMSIPDVVDGYMEIVDIDADSTIYMTDLTTGETTYLFIV